MFENVVKLEHKEIIENAEIIEDKFSVIKNLFPNATNKMINHIISILEGKRELK